MHQSMTKKDCRRGAFKDCRRRASTATKLWGRSANVIYIGGYCLYNLCIPALGEEPRYRPAIAKYNAYFENLEIQ